MSTVTPVQLVAPVRLAASDTSVYTAPTVTTAKIGRAVFCNTDSSPHTITAGITTGGSLSGANTLISPVGRILAAGESYVSPELAGAVIPAGSQLHCFADSANVVTFTASGLTIV